MTTPSGIRHLVRSLRDIALPNPSVKRLDSGPSISYQIIARTERELKSIVADLNERYQQSFDSSAILETNPIRPHPLNEPIGFQINVHGPEAERSIIKSALGLACDAGIAPAVADMGLRFLTDPRGMQCSFPYYVQDLVKNRPHGVPIHCVSVAADPSSALLLAYVELYGIIRRIVCLSSTYGGERVVAHYAIDPTTGASHDLKVAIDSGAYRRAEKYYATAEMLEGIQKAFDEVIASFMREEVEGRSTGEVDESDM